MVVCMIFFVYIYHEHCVVNILSLDLESQIDLWWTHHKHSTIWGNLLLRIKILPTYPMQVANRSCNCRVPRKNLKVPKNGFGFWIKHGGIGLVLLHYKHISRDCFWNVVWTLEDMTSQAVLSETQVEKRSIMYGEIKNLKVPTHPLLQNSQIFVLLPWWWNSQFLKTKP